MRGAGKGRREEVLTGGAGLSAEAAAERERTGAEWAAVRAGTGMCGAGCGRGLGRAGAGLLGPAQEGKKRARARVKQAGAWAGASGFAAERAVLRAEIKGWAEFDWIWVFGFLFPFPFSKTKQNLFELVRIQQP